MVNIAISGAGRGGSALLDILESEEEITIVGIADKNENAPALKIAQEREIFTTSKIEDFIDLSTHIVINATGFPEHSEVIKKTFPYPVDVIEGESARLLWTIVNSHKKSQTDIESLYVRTKLVSAAKSLQEALDEILTSSIQITSSPGGSIALIEDDEISISSQVGLSAELAKHSRGKLSGNKFASKVLKGKKPLAFHNIKDDPIFDGTIFLKEGIKSMLAVSLISNDKALGLLCLHDLKTRHYSKREKNLVGLVSSTAAQAIEKFKLLHEKEKSLNYLQNVLNDSQDMIITTDNEGRIVKFSQGGERILGFTQEEMAGKEVINIYANKRERSEIQKTLQKQGAIYNYETTLLKKDSSPIDISLTISQLKNEKGNIIGTVGISKNITEEKRLRKELEEKNIALKKSNESLEQKVLERTKALEESNRELKKASEMKDRFIANSSHELRTPLNAIIGFSEILLEKSFGEINEKQERYISNMFKAGMHLLHLVNNLLDLAKIESGKTDLDYDRFKLNALVDEVFSVLGPIAQKNDIKLVNDIASDIDISADKVKLKQIFYNLFSNAIKFTAEGGKSGIRVEKVKGDASLPWAPAGEEFIKMSIWDTGMGIGVDDLHKVFYEFEQADSSKATEGSGLGLSVTKRLIELHSGHIDVESKLGEGSTFNIYLPAMVPTWTREEEKPSTTSISAKLPEQGEGPLILVAEDDLPTSEILTVHLTQAGYRVAHAYDGVEAIRKAKEEKPFVIALDIMLPRKDGWEVLQELKADKNTCEIPIIIHSMIDNKELAFALGATDYLVKPASKESLLSKLQSLPISAQRDEKPITVIVLTSDDAFQQSLQNILDTNSDRYLLHCAETADQGLELALATVADAIIIDTSIQGGGFKVVEEYKKHPLLKETPVFALTEKGYSTKAKKEILTQIEAVFNKDALNSKELLSHLNNLKVLYPEKAGLTDELTGLFNSRYFDIRITQEVSRARRYKIPLGIAFLSIDHFEQARKDNGERHTGRTLKKIADFLRVNLRTSDIVSRSTSDSFTIIFPNTPSKSAQQIAQRFVSAIACIEGTDKATVSIGLSEYSGQTVNDLLHVTNTALSLAKEKGGNRVEIATNC